MVHLIQAQEGACEKKIERGAANQWNTFPYSSGCYCVNKKGQQREELQSFLNSNTCIGHRLVVSHH